MMMKCVSWNVRGLEAPDRKHVIKDCLNSIKSIDFLILRELKTTKFNLEVSLDFIWKDSIKICSNHPKGRGGVGILINIKWEKHLTHSGLSPCNRVVWATFSMNNFFFGVCIVYAPNDYKDINGLWNYLASLSDTPWIIGGDFNMIKHHEDKCRGNPSEWKVFEKTHWDRFKQHKDLLDPLADNKRDHVDVWYTWCNCQKGVNRIYSRLDCFYANKNFFSFLPDDQGNLLCVSPATISDHHPIVA